MKQRLHQLEAESIYILREVVAELNRPNDDRRRIRSRTGAPRRTPTRRLCYLARNGHVATLILATLTGSVGWRRVHLS
jgi:hypothetical protein